MKKLFTLLCFLPALAFAAGGGVPLQRANTDLTDLNSLHNGAKLFVNYCQGCHSAKYMRYNRIGQDLGISDDLLRETLMFNTDKVGDTMQTALDPQAAKAWFGVTPPDLSVITRARGVDWVYTYLLSFYEDESKPTGTNNLVFKDVGMPHVLWEMQGRQKAVVEMHKGADGHDHEVIVGVEPADDDAKAKAPEYKRNMRDLVAFLEYVGEPAKVQRLALGPYVLGFLFFFLIVAFILKKDYWRDIH